MDDTFIHSAAKEHMDDLMDLFKVLRKYGCSDFRILNEKLVKINHAFPLVRDCIEQLGRKKCHYLSMINLRDAFHTLCLALSSQKYCGITLYYRSPTYHYLRMGMGISVKIGNKFGNSS